MVVKAVRFSDSPESKDEAQIKRIKLDNTTNENKVSLKSRSIPSSLRFTVLQHPLGVRPSGNGFISSSETIAKKTQLLGDFSRFNDEIILKIISYLNHSKDLFNLSQASRIMYGFINYDDIWRNLYNNSMIYENTEDFKKIESWRGSWRKTILNFPFEDNENKDYYESQNGDDYEQEIKKIKCYGNILCSDLLYRPYECSQINYKKLFKNIIDEETVFHENRLTDFRNGRVLRVKESEMDINRFNQYYHDKPFILIQDKNIKNDGTDGVDGDLENNDKVEKDTSYSERWPTHWNIDYLSNRFSDVRFRQESVRWKLGMYAQYCKKNIDESPLYLFDCDSDAMKQLRKEYRTPEIFQEDLFKLFNMTDNQSNESSESINCRPDHAWLIMGPERSGSTYHKDPNYTCAWNSVLVGRKLWVMLPPDVTPPGVMTNDTESEVTTPLGLAEWVLSGFFNDAVKISDNTVREKPENSQTNHNSQFPVDTETNSCCLIGITFPGECIYVPAGWWHMVINLDDSVALTQNFVPLVKLSETLNFLKNKREQISGFHSDKVYKFLRKFIDNNTNKENPTKFDDLNLEKFNTFLNDVADFKNDDEDVGEIDQDKCSELPIFELFQELLISTGYKESLQEALIHLKKIEIQHKRKLNGGVKKSEVWENLTTSTDENKEEPSSFSFGFNFDDDDDDNDDE
ncbi:hypothetical protein B5S32_g341 [[Candida] boidinii]|nr:hypothetical protein B5S32_g341 [[Candida] boidinii]